MKNTIEAGYVEKVCSDTEITRNKEWYIPHHPAVNPKKPGKV